MIRVLVFFLFSVLINSKIYSNSYADTPKSHNFHALISAKPVLNWVSKIDSSSNFLGSNTLLEFQYQNNRHILGIGANYNRKIFSTQINNLPFEEIITGYILNLYYGYNIYHNKKLKIFTGLGYVMNYNFKEQSITSNIERINNTATLREEGINFFFRFNYAFNSKLSIETELSLYNLKSTNTYKENYPLTPSLNYIKYSVSQKTHFSVPANLYLKYSF